MIQPELSAGRMRRGRLVSVLVLLASCAPGPAPASGPSSPAADPAPIAEAAAPEVLVYRRVEERGLRAYVFRSSNPPGGSRPAAVLLFHGGGWSVGEPAWTFDAARRFAAHGVTAIPVEYRLSEGNVTPIDALADVCAAFEWARDHADELGLDGDRIAGYGVSAGGHLVASTVTVGCPGDGASELPEAPDALLLWSPALDLTHDRWFERKLQGRATAEAYSPAAHVRAGTPPTSIVHGREDTLTPLSGAREYCRRLRELDGVCELSVFEGVGHLLTRNLEYQEGDFDPDPEAVAAGVAAHLAFLGELGFISADD